MRRTHWLVFHLLLAVALPACGSSKTYAGGSASGTVAGSTLSVASSLAVNAVPYNEEYDGGAASLPANVAIALTNLADSETCADFNIPKMRASFGVNSWITMSADLR